MPERPGGPSASPRSPANSSAEPRPESGTVGALGEFRDAYAKYMLAKLELLAADLQRESAAYKAAVAKRRFSDILDAGVRLTIARKKQEHADAKARLDAAGDAMERASLTGCGEGFRAAEFAHIQALEGERLARIDFEKFQADPTAYLTAAVESKRKGAKR